jgi:hypothetical protein
MINKQGLIPVVITTVVVSILSLSITGQNKPETTFHAKGYLVDIECAVIHDTQGNGNWGVTHNRRCLESEASKKSGFALLLPNGEIYRFDPEGNALALKAIASTKKDNDFRIEVTGVLDNNVLRVTSLLLLK